MKYSPIGQAWVIIVEGETFKKQLIKEEITIKQGLDKLQKKIFYSKEEAKRDSELQKKYHPNFKFSYKIIFW